LRKYFDLCSAVKGCKTGVGACISDTKRSKTVIGISEKAMMVSHLVWRQVKLLSGDKEKLRRGFFNLGMSNPTNCKEHALGMNTKNS